MAGCATSGNGLTIATFGGDFLTFATRTKSSFGGFVDTRATLKTNVVTNWLCRLPIRQDSRPMKSMSRRQHN